MMKQNYRETSRSFSTARQERPGTFGQPKEGGIGTSILCQKKALISPLPLTLMTHEGRHKKNSQSCCEFRVAAQGGRPDTLRRSESC